MIKVIISGGGTGGHVFPAIAIANALKALDSNIDILLIFIFWTNHLTY